MTPATTEEYFDLSYAEEPASYYYLVLEISPVEVKAMWYHSTKNLVTGFARYPFNGSLSELFSNFKFLKSEFKEVLICVYTDNYLVTPRTLASSNDPNVFQLTNSYDSDEETLKSFQLVNLKADITYALNQNLEHDIHSLIKHHRVLPHLAPALENELNILRKSSSDAFVVAHISSQSVDVRVYKDNKLQLANAYFQSSPEDIAYYILYASEILDINPDQQKLVLSGVIEMGDETWKLLSNYWKTLSIDTPLEGIEVSQQLSGFSNAEFAPLTHALLCAS